MSDDLIQFIGEQRKEAEREPDHGVKYGMMRVIGKVERFGLNMVPSSSAGEWVPVAEAAKRHSVKIPTIRQWKRLGKIKWRQPGGKYGHVQYFVTQ